jgi:hypothetical protein
MPIDATLPSYRTGARCGMARSGHALHGGIAALTLRRKRMKAKVVLAAALIASFAAPALAAEFYIVQDATTKKCTIVDKKPSVTTTTVIGNTVYQTRTEAETGLKTVKVCTEK